MRADSSSKTEYDFDLGHLKVVLALALILLTVTFFKNGFRFAPEKEKAQPALTYDQVRTQVAADMPGGSNADQVAQQLDAQLALIDPDFGSGAVLGLSTETVQSMNIKSVDEAYGTNVDDVISVVQLDDTNAFLMQQYRNSIADEITTGEIGEILMALNSSDKDLYATVPDKVNSVLQTYLTVPVPKEAARYHRLNILYYIELSALSKALMTEATVENFGTAQEISERLLSVTTEMEKERATLMSKWGVQL